MLDNIKDSIKAKLYDFAYTPFMSSFVISWIIINHKYILIYFGDEKVADKIKLLDAHVFEKIPYQGYDWWADQFWYPFGIALAYVFVYPLLALGFYAATLWYKKLSKDVKTKIEKITPIHPDEAKKIREDIVRLEEEKDDALNKLTKKEDEYKEKIENELRPLQEKIGSLEMQLVSSEQQNKKLIEEKNSLDGQLNHSNKMMELKIEECEELKTKVTELEKQLASVDIINATVQVNGVQAGQTTVSNQSSDDFTKVVKYLHDSYKNMMEEDLIAKLMSDDIGIASAVARKIINQFIDEKVLYRSTTGVISITSEGSSKLVELMKGMN